MSRTTLGEAIELIRKEGANKARLHHNEKNPISQEQAKALGRAAAQRLLNNLKSWERPADHVDHFVDEFMTSYIDMRNFLRDQQTLPFTGVLCLTS